MRSRRGFTLLELLIGMALLGLILALLFAGFRLATQSWDAVDGRIQRATDDQASLAFLLRLVGALQPLHWNRDPQRPLTFAGEAGRLTMVATLAEQTGPRVVSLSVVPVTSPTPPLQQVQLVLREQAVPYSEDFFAKGLDERTGRVIRDGLTAAEFRYLGSESDRDPLQWQDHWAHNNRLPVLIHIRLTTVSGAPIDIVAPTLVSGDRNAATRIVVGGTL
jgi:general secretion pathway protein J